ncbi:MAG: hypothetical protein ACI8X5_003101 [Planctomycetota bacterium]|jgi:hypothetical protein
MRSIPACHLTLLVTLSSPGLALAQVPAPSFTNVTQQMGLDSVYAPNPFIHSQYGGGGAVGDFDNDGVQEIFLMRGGFHGTSDRFYKLGPGNTYVDEAAAWGLDEVHNGRGCAVGDFNNDGFLDLYVTSGGPPPFSVPGKHKLFKNNGNGSFTDVAVSAGVNATSLPVEDGWGAAFGDYDLDGDLDLFVAGHANQNAGTRLFRNNGDETFTDVTMASGIISENSSTIFSFAPRFLDTDGDRYPEMIIAGDYGTVRYYRNNTDGTFTDITVASGVDHAENAMGQTFGDWNNDGLVDWYSSSIYEPVANWTGSKIYFNQGAHSFLDVSAPAGVADGGYAWAAISVDFNHDGMEDIAETNGEENFSNGQFNNEQSYLHMNVAGQTAFNEMALQSGFVHTDEGRGMFNFDMDNDGDQDVLICTFNGPAQLYRNEIAGLPNANWSRLFLDTSTNHTLAPNGYGSKVTLTIGSESQVRHLVGGDNFLSCSELSVHFGIGTETLIDELRIDWADGQTTTLLNVAPNQTQTVVAPPAKAGFSYCVGDGTGAACPCGNTGNAGAGCANSSGGGATMTGAGQASFASDTLTFGISGVPGAKPGLLIRGNNQVNGGLGNGVGDGLFCAGGASQRSQVYVTDATGNTILTNWYGAGFGSVANMGTATNYQFWFRDPMVGPCATGFNFSNAWTVTYTP